jgi:hypothetical protein
LPFDSQTASSSRWLFGEFVDGYCGASRNSSVSARTNTSLDVDILYSTERNDRDWATASHFNAWSAERFAGPSEIAQLRAARGATRENTRRI